MATHKLSKTVVDKLPIKSTVYIAYDDSLAGFGCRVTPKGARSWIVEYRPHGGGRGVAKKRITLGPVSLLTPDQARKVARDVLAKAHLGADVAIDRAERRSALSVRELADKFMKEEVAPTRKPRTRGLYEMYLRVHILPELGDKRAPEITRADVTKLHRAVGKDAKVTGNRLLMLLSGLYSWAGRAGEAPEGFNPARGITRFREQGRERYLSSDELGRLGDALREAETVGIPWMIDDNNPKSKHVPKENRRTQISPFATAALRLLLFTGCRLREILHLRWADYDAERGMLFLPDSKTGRKAVVLPQPAIAVVEALPRAGKYVIMGERPDRPRSDLKRPWEVIRRRAGLEDVRLHDLRHSFASVGVAGNFGLPVIGKLLGQKRAETTNRYAHLAIAPLKSAADTIAGILATEMGEGTATLKQGAQVIELPRG